MDDFFYDYLEYCENAELIGPGEFVELLDRHRLGGGVRGKTKPLTWTRLTIDLLDTWKAGTLLRQRTNKGSAAYVREKGHRSTMGMFDKDKQFAPDGRLDEMFPPGKTDSREGAEVILWGVEDRGEFPTEIGTAQMTWLTVSSIPTPDEKKVVGTLAKAIASKAAEADDSDFPCVVKVMKVSTEMADALVLQWMGAYDAKTGKVTVA